MFKVGDKVKIVKKVTERTPDFQNSWTDAMDDKIGSIVTVRRIIYSGVYFNEIPLGYPPASLVKIGFSSFDEVINYMKRGGYVLAELLDNIPVCYRIRNGNLEINTPNLKDDWVLSFYNIQDIKKGSVTKLELFTKRKYSWVL